MVQPKTSSLRPGGGPLAAPGPFRRPGAGSVGTGPIGCDARGFEGYANERVAQNVDMALGLTQLGISVFDYWARQQVAQEHAAAATQAIKDERGFDPGKFGPWYAANASDDAALANEPCARFFARPFAGVVVQQNLYTEVVEDGEYAYHFEEPMTVFLAEIAGPDEVTGFESAQSAGPTIGAVPRLKRLVTSCAGQGSIDSFANDVLTQVWWVLTMRAVALYPRSAWGWTVAETRTVDRCPPGLLEWLLWKVLGI